MITAYFGKMRSGKTYAMTEEVVKLLNGGEVVYSNYFINWTGQEKKAWYKVFFHKLGIWKIKRYPKSNLRTFVSWDEIEDVTECTVALDEGWLYFNSYVRLPIHKQRRLMQSGKRRMDFLYTTQRPLQTDINLRWNTDMFIECKMVKIPFLSKPLLIRKWYDLREDDSNAIIDKVRIMQSKDGLKEVDMCLKTAFGFAKQKIYDVYDTTFEIYEDADQRKLFDKKYQEDVADRAGWIDPLPTFWSDVMSLVKFGHGNRQVDRLAKRSQGERKIAMVEGVPVRRSDNVRSVVLTDIIRK